MLKGERVTLRAVRREDLARVIGFGQDMELQMLDCAMPRPVMAESIQAYFEEWARPNDNLAFFAIEADGKYIGDCCLSGIQDPHGCAELGIVIGDRDYWSKGYGREAIGLLVDYGFQLLGLRRIWLSPNAKNERAIRSYQACGFIEEGRPRKVTWIDGEYVDIVDLSMLREDWLALRAKKEAGHA